MGWLAVKREGSHNRLRNTVSIFTQFAVPEAHHAPTERFQEVRSPLVIRGSLKVLASIDLNCQFSRSTGEVEDVRPDR